MGATMSELVTDSRFYMWRAIVAMAHADGVVTPHEISFIHEYAQDVSFSKEQIGVLATDLQTPQDPYEMFSRIDVQEDKKDFFALARALSWCDGDFAAQEQQIIKCLERVFANDENAQLLEESRDMAQNLRLCSEQEWAVEAVKTKGIMGFLTKLTSA